ncbi:hypothetical protein PV783_34110 [Chitinophaga sp. CC14]|uniref:hypothetical protein n=1 Tax=Chitinophaga sp. CC14 TaxID=3029199 RepID=UPI003B7817D7
MQQPFADLYIHVPNTFSRDETHWAIGFYGEKATFLFPSLTGTMGVVTVTTNLSIPPLAILVANLKDQFKLRSVMVTFMKQLNNEQYSDFLIE